jgi:phosphohistidine phosphatase
MNELYILRHGIAVPHGTPGVAEDDRPLTPKGEQRMRQIGRGLAALGLKVDRIVTSPLLRARRTAQIVAQELAIVDRLETSSALLIDSDAHAIRGWLRERSESSLMIVGHNPALSDLVGLLTLGEEGRLPVELKKGGIAALSSAPLAGPRFKLEWLAPPALLRRLAQVS